ncbi:hypothetical protein [Flavobacterium sp. CSZ]|uniref:hypothetical protein n=1 Tax=Flavobacterium sp. CSZ TaxID=2783791 RepID=UPI00188D5A7D|nr:hypothetical protein [Flavobacterium sp. CSZ]MBF4484392.1 hypothetical protein [Flavobacterium sp. CSZ]
MNKKVKRLINSLNYYFDCAHHLSKNNRSVHALYLMLLYNSKRYKESIRLIQNAASRRVKIDKRELVAVSIGAKSNKVGVFGTSHVRFQESDFEKKLAAALKTIGVIGDDSILQGTYNIVGKCAEAKAANNALRRDKKASLNAIQFTSAIRPRTSEKQSRCINCIAVFGNE